MNDINLDWGTDLNFGPTGDLAVVTGSDAITQRVYRRLLTNAGDYLWQGDYGASLGNFVGAPADPNQIEGVIRSQLLLETAVPTNPSPAVSVIVTDKANGIVTANITYADPTSLTPIAISIAAAAVSLL